MNNAVNCQDHPRAMTCVHWPERISVLNAGESGYTLIRMEVGAISKFRFEKRSEAARAWMHELGVSIVQAVLNDKI